MEIFHRIKWEDWHLLLAGIALIMIFSVFILVVIRIWFTSNSKLDYLSKLPLEDDNLPHEKGTDHR